MPMSVTTEKIRLKNGTRLVVTKAVSEETVTVSLVMEKAKDCFLHWGVMRPGSPDWQRPAQQVWPKGTKPFNRKAVQTPFSHQNGAGSVSIRIHRSEGILSMPFALYFPQEDVWDNNKGKNYIIDIGFTKKDKPTLAPITYESNTDANTWEHMYSLNNGVQILATVRETGDHHEVTIVTNLPVPLILHWGVATGERHQWHAPKAAIRPKGTKIVEKKAGQTPFSDDETLRKVQISIPKEKAPLGIPFVVKDPDTDQWFNDGGRNFYIPLTIPKAYQDVLKAPMLSDLADIIVEREMGRHGWTLMHRYDLCHDLVDRVHDSDEGWAMIFVWLRFSALRQLDWQRNYNTKPRELAHALDRLTRKLARCYREQPVSREFIRVMLTGLGRGGEGQRVRDEILHIMHRHHIKEVAGHFLEEWHQKLHNNTTPDDVVICEAYLAFLGNNGDLSLFYDTLKQGGVTKKRLRSYERPIRSDPDFIPHLKDALLHDFSVFLRILKGVHTGIDLDVAVQAASPYLEGAVHEAIDHIRALRNKGLPANPLAEKTTEARRWLTAQRDLNNHALRDLLFLDLALEDFLRVGIEQKLHTMETMDILLPLVGLIIENVIFSYQDEELLLCLRHWKALIEKKSRSAEWALETKSLFDRTGRIIGERIDHFYRTLQPKAELLGEAFKAAPWSITLFSEAVIRGRPIFLLSSLLRKIDPLLRKMAHLGNWQIISPGSTSGAVMKVPALKAVQTQTIEEPTVIVTSAVDGDEELPKNVTAVITTDTVDIVSHVAIRARNSNALFATCYDQNTMAKLESLQGSWIAMTATTTGEVTFEKSSRRKEAMAIGEMEDVKPVSLEKPSFSDYALSSDAFDRTVVGAKSNHLRELRGRLPHWIQLPESIAVPFGVFEKVLSDGINKSTADAYTKMSETVDALAADARPAMLKEIRQTVLGLHAPRALRQRLNRIAEATSLPWEGASDKGWGMIWSCIKKVWASKWNERAYLSRMTMGIPHGDLFMAVLIQEVIKADYAFVIHTVHPISGAENDIFGEIVIGLGETLVSNDPGRAMSFSCSKGDVSNIRILSFPSKGTALFGQGMIFRSDSNGEDLSHYAGAGLYDSFTTEPSRRELIDYSKEKIVIDKQFRMDLLSQVAKIGMDIENALGTPQDIEGVYSNGRYYVVQTRPQVGIGSQ